MYTKNETALLTLISNINNQFYYIGEEEDKDAPVDVKKFTQYCVDFIDSLEKEKRVKAKSHGLLKNNLSGGVMLQYGRKLKRKQCAYID